MPQVDHVFERSIAEADLWLIFMIFPFDGGVV